MLDQEETTLKLLLEVHKRLSEDAEPANPFCAPATPASRHSLDYLVKHPDLNGLHLDLLELMRMLGREDGIESFKLMYREYPKKVEEVLRNTLGVRRTWNNILLALRGNLPNHLANGMNLGQPLPPLRKRVHLALLLMFARKGSFDPHGPEFSS
jgi:hypothetical protein